MSQSDKRIAEAADHLRRAAIASDNQGHFLREAAFDLWRETTLFPVAVNRWIEGCRP